MELFRGTPYDYFAVAPAGSIVFTAGACPLDAEVKAAIGDKVYAAESVLAWLKPPTTNRK